MTLVEMIIAIVIINVGLMGVMLTFITVVKTSVNPMIYKQMAAVADGMMEEIMLKPFAAAANGGAANSCARDTFNDVRDYNNYTTSNACTVEGDAIAQLAGYQVNVTVRQGANAAMPTIPASDLLKITITVTKGAESYVLSGWRTCYGGPPCN
jgi:MSHA pilin protein MshD